MVLNRNIDTDQGQLYVTGRWRSVTVWAKSEQQSGLWEMIRVDCGLEVTRHLMGVQLRGASEGESKERCQGLLGTMSLKVD